jgi:hypothetical protein
MSKALWMLGLLLVAPLARGQEPQFPVHLTARTASEDALLTKLPSIQTVTVPADTQAAISMLSGMHTQVSHVDDPVEATLLKPVYVRGQLALPAGTLLEGRIIHVRPAGRMHHPGELGFRFESISLPDGQSAPISAYLSGYAGPRLPKVRMGTEGSLHGTRGFSLKRLAFGISSVGALSAAKALVVGGSSLAYFLPAGGAAIAGFEIFFPRGNDVHVPPDTRFRIRLSNPVTVRVSG